ncbi:MAG: lysylphosphatidylglycerol synthase transmembrane domain-containing protein [Pyrinomonadaceae bacterium]
MRKHLRFVLFALLAALILWWFGRGLDWAEVKRSIEAANGRLLLVAIFVVCATYWVRALRWRALLAPLAPASMRELFVATTIGFSAVVLFGRTGEVVRPIVLPLREPRVRPAASFVTIGVERIYDMVAVVLLFSANLLAFHPSAEQATEFAHARFAGLLLLAGCALGLASLVLFRFYAPGVIHWLDERFAHWSFVPERVGRGITGVLEQLAQALGVLTNARELFVTIGWTCVLWFAIVLANLLVLRAFGLPFGFSETIFMLGWALVGSLVPTPGGAAGAYHGATAAGLVILGVSKNHAAAIVLVLHPIVFAPALIFGLYYFLRGDINIARLRQLVSNDEAKHAANEETGTRTVLTESAPEKLQPRVLQ